MQIKTGRPEIVFHLAAQPLVRASYRNPLETFSTNVMGTANVLEALKELDGTRVAVFVTTDKVYQNREWQWPYREDDSLGGHDPYSASKAASEIIIASYRQAFLSAQGIAVASARAGNVIGGGDWSEDRLVPDAVRAWQAGIPLHVRNPGAVRPWQHVLEPLAGYLGLARKLWEQPGLVGRIQLRPQRLRGFNRARSRRTRGGSQWQGKSISPMPMMGRMKRGRLAWRNAKARLTLGIESKWALAQAIDLTMGWYRTLNDGADARPPVRAGHRRLRGPAMSRFTITDLPLAGLKLIQRKPIMDERGFLARIFCAEELAVAGWHEPVAQINHTRTTRVAPSAGCTSNTRRMPT